MDITFKADIQILFMQNKFF